MNNKEKIVKGIETTIEGLQAILVAMKDSGADITPTETKKADTKKVETAKEVKETVKETVKEEVKEESTVEGKFSKADLDAMKYNDLKKLGKDLGIKPTGTRDEITDKILAVGVNVSAEDDSEEEEETKEDTKVTPISSGKNKLGKAKKEEKAEDEIDEDALEQAKAIMDDKDTTLADIIGALEEVGVKVAKKKDKDLITNLLAKAIQDGLIDLEEDEEEDGEEETATNEESEDEDIEIDENSYFADFDPEGYNDPDNMTKKRAKAVKTLVGEIIESIENEELTEEDMTSYLEENTTDDEKELLDDDASENDIIMFYIEMKKRTISDNGEVAEPSDPYELQEKNMCCGHELKYVKKNKKFVCSICGEEYSEED